MSRAEFHGLPARQLRQAGRQLARTRHRCPVDKDRDNADTACQRCLDLQAHQVPGLIQAPAPVFACPRQPGLADHCQQHGASADGSRDLPGEVIAWLKGVNVLEHAVPAEAPG